MVLWIERSLLGLPCCKREEKVDYWALVPKREKVGFAGHAFAISGQEPYFTISEWPRNLFPFFHGFVCQVAHTDILLWDWPSVLFPESEVNTITVSVFAPLLKLGGTYPITNRTQRKTPFSGWTPSRRGCPRCRSRWPWRRWRELWSSRCAEPSCNPRSGWSSS